MLVTLLLCALGAVQPGEGPIGVALLRLEGPTGGALLEAGGPPTEVWLELRAGESRTLAVPLELGPLAAPGPPAADGVRVLALPGSAATGVATLVGWEMPPHPAPAFAGDPGPDGERRALERLVRRPRPPLAPARPRVGVADLAWIGALLCLGLVLRRRPWLAAALGIAGALLVFAGSTARPAVAAVRVWEGDLAAGVWLEVRTALERLALEPGEAQPARPGREGCARTYRVDARGADVRWWALAPGCELFVARRLAPPELAAGTNGLGRLDPFWVRDPTGAWERRAAWDTGAALPVGPQPGAADLPPAWLAAALPQGREVWIGRLVRPSTEGPTPPWVRVLGP